MNVGDAARSIRTWLTRAFLGTVLLGAFCAYGQTTEPARATTPTAGTVDLEVFQAPQVKKYGAINYPENERVSNREGWVDLNFMIDPAGKAYEISVSDSSGNEIFEREAIKAMERTQFTPATFGGKPVDSGFELKVRFQLSGPGAGASSKFVRDFKKLRTAVEKGDKAASDAALEKLKGENLYELAYVGAVKYEYFLKWGTEAEQLDALSEAIAAEKKPDYLPKDMFNAMLVAMFRLQLLRQNFGAASATWATMQKNDVDPKVLADFKPIMDNVAKLRTDDRAFAIQAEIRPNRPAWFTLLHKKKFHVEVSSGKLAEVKLRCDKKYVFFPFDPQLEYRIADAYGACSLELVGDPGTKFKLVQS